MDIPNHVRFRMGWHVLGPLSQHKQATIGPEPEDNDVFPSELDASPMLAVGTKRHAKLDDSGCQEVKNGSWEGSTEPFENKNIQQKLATTWQKFKIVHFPMLLL